jgi:hypothetical protein
MSNTTVHSANLREAADLLVEAMSEAGVRVRSWETHPSAASVVINGAPAGEKPRTWAFKILRDGSSVDSTVEGGLWVVRRAGAARRRELRSLGQSYIDLATGALHLRRPGLVIDRQGRVRRVRGPAGRTGLVVNPFADRSSLLVRRLFLEPDRSWGVREIALAAGISPMMASGAVKRLESLGVVQVEASYSYLRAAVRLVSRRRLIEAWAATYDWERNRSCTFSAPVGDPMRFLRRLAPSIAGHRWATTLQAGASLEAPHAHWDKIHIYVEVANQQELRVVGREAGWTPHPEGRVVLMQPYYRQALWGGVRQIEGISVVSALQLIMDLWSYPVRGREQAEHLLMRIEEGRG